MYDEYDLVTMTFLIHRKDREIIRSNRIRFAPVARRALAEACGRDPEAFNRNVNTPGGYRERRKQENET